MKNFILIVLVLFVIAYSFWYFQQKKNNDPNTGLDLQALTYEATQKSSAEELEKSLNSENGINNLDINKDGKRDFLKVTEYGDDKVRGFSYSVELEKNDEQEIATTEFIKDEEKKELEATTRSNNSYYGNNHSYHYRSPIYSALIYGWLFSRNRGYYHSPYNNNYSPSYFNKNQPKANAQNYRTRVSNAVPQQAKSSVKTSSYAAPMKTSPNAKKSSSTFSNLKRKATSRRSSSINSSRRFSSSRSFRGGK